jgi:hypothetical protein
MELYLAARVCVASLNFNTIKTGFFVLLSNVLDTPQEYYRVRMRDSLNIFASYEKRHFSTVSAKKFLYFSQPLTTKSFPISIADSVCSGDPEYIKWASA